MDKKEKRFEEDIESSLLKSGYEKGDLKTYDRERAIDMPKLITFIRKTQPKQWIRYTKIYGDSSENKLYRRFQDSVEANGLLYVLRHGFKDRGVQFKVCAFKPNSTLSDKVMADYDANILEVTRQFNYSTENENSIDIVLLLNGIPIVALELKDQLTGQSVANAMRQWKEDRNPRELCFHRDSRFLVYFAVDLYEVEMTTELKGDATYFLPFNQGSNGAGNVGGAGNPENPNGYATAYLWEHVLQKDTLMTIIQKFMLHEFKETLNKNGNKHTRERMIFPRYHQLDSVTKMLDDAKKNGAGKNYLIQHSAGSGKSNSIAWLAYGLSNLFDRYNESIFRSVIVVTDRRVLDSQLQDTIYQFDHVRGTVVKIDRNKTSKDLRDAINSGAKIIITTLQKFPVIFDQIEGTEGKNFAVIVDEAHSSQTGNSAKKLRAALADKEASLKEFAEMEAKTEAEVKDEEDIIVEQMLAHGKHKNLSFFAFTATPKPQTLETFGTKDPEGHFRPFHVYSMKQAIEEGFILNVLDHYMTYQDCYKLVNETPENPEVPVSKAVKVIKRYESLHPYVLSQKVPIIVETYRSITAHKIHGRAKAMVVTASRLHAIRYYQEIKKYINEKGYKDVDILVAFSGSVEADGVEYTEPGMNIRSDGTHIKENQLPEEFAGDEYQMLVVAEKYQTGFDEPLLHTMFVDKKLKGVKAVQTLSRLNRTYPGKNDTLIIDFANTKEDIQAAFQPYYEETTLDKAVDVNLIYDTQTKLRNFRLYDDTDVQAFIDIYKKQQSDTDLGKITSILLPVINGYQKLADDDRFIFKKTVRNYCKWYSYITTVTKMFDRELEEEYIFCQYLDKLLPSIHDPDMENIEDKLKLDYFKLKQTYDGEIELEESSDESELKNPKKVEVKPRDENDEELNQILDNINEHYNGIFTEQDKVIATTLIRKVQEEDQLKTFAQNNDKQVYVQSIFPEIFSKIAQECYVQSMNAFKKLFENKELYNAIMNSIGKESFYDFNKQGKADE